MFKLAFEQAEAELLFTRDRCLRACFWVTVTTSSHVMHASGCVDRRQNFFNNK